MSFSVGTAEAVALALLLGVLLVALLTVGLTGRQRPRTEKAPVLLPPVVEMTETENEKRGSVVRIRLPLRTKQPDRLDEGEVHAANSRQTTSTGKENQSSPVQAASELATTLGESLSAITSSLLTPFGLMNRPRLSALYIYPIKSCGAVRVRSAQLDETGLRYDRWWCVVDSRNRVITQREQRCLALIRPSLTEHELLLAAPNMPSVSVPLSLPGELRRLSLVRKVTVMRTACKGFYCASEVNEWISDFIHQQRKQRRRAKGQRAKIRKGRFFLFRSASSSSRELVDDWLWSDLAEGRERTKLSDLSALTVVSGASLDSLNEKLERPVHALQFRPNLVLSGLLAFEEDHWQSFTVGKGQFRVLKQTHRCAVCCIDQETAERDPHHQPLNALRQFRLCDERVFPEQCAPLPGPSPFFGVSASVANESLAQRRSTTTSAGQPVNQSMRVFLAVGDEVHFENRVVTTPDSES
mmetsp:Transcript_5692/g.17442  ORF Transcript_5692/g.17442 Transcript_5692/m.17442 type:complete len:469 (+) Transcript_5692:64-1470(+)|eukprot:CAMPEP_0174232914 /NCGR_PEP_ID=MMETSP0417-20130205/3080_1 /TAXON_ID=242541 /ORGANISM="Mayorella sp, Strain BSH-02190019" /LENGTH=468 /DNA_ID=CAMNT_0015311043 /DNA_START=61 /DNA_END=1467 /DNA_ORIENTATION=-